MKTRQDFQIVNFYTCKEKYSKKYFVLFLSQVGGNFKNGMNHEF